MDVIAGNTFEIKKVADLLLAYLILFYLLQTLPLIFHLDMSHVKSGREHSDDIRQ
jgi:hypothetical protein